MRRGAVARAASRPPAVSCTAERLYLAKQTEGHREHPELTLLGSLRILQKFYWGLAPPDIPTLAELAA